MLLNPTNFGAPYEGWLYLAVVLDLFSRQFDDCSVKSQTTVI
jgi:hypothetical protein